MYVLFYKHYCLLLLYLIFGKTVTALGEQCSTNKEASCQATRDHSLWTEWENRILKLIEDSRSRHQPCLFGNASCFRTTIEKDLKPFSRGVTRELINLGRSSYSVIRYQMINQTLYRDKSCMFPTRCSGNEHFLLKYTDGSDYEILINVHDWAQSYSNPNPAPIFSFSKTDDYSDILYPAWSFWSGGPATKLYPTGLGRWDKFYKLLINETKKWPWSKKLDVGFFRGSRTSPDRDNLIYLSRDSPDLVDAVYTKNQAFKSKEKDTLNADPAEEVPMEYHCRYKYLFNFRGVAASFRFRHLLLCKSLVFHVGNDWKEFFYPQLTPWIHYIPLNRDYTKEDVRDLLTFFKKHDHIAEEIASQGYNFIKSHLKLSTVSSYWKILLEEYTKLLKYKPVLDPELIKLGG